MTGQMLPKLLPITVASAGVALLLAWMQTGATVRLAARVPGADHAPPLAVEAKAPNLAGVLTAGVATAATLPGDWPGWRGPGRDGISHEALKLARKWPAGGPKALWQLELGEGYAAAAVHAGRVYLLDYDRANQSDVLGCLSLADGQPIWRYSYPVRIKRNHGMSRTIPAVTDKHVVAIGPKCHVTCLDALTGKLAWGIDLVADFGSQVPEWYAGQCPLVEDGRVIIAPAGPEVLMMALDLATGSVLWKCPNPMRWKMSHSSIVPIDVGGKRQYVYAAAGGVAGVSAHDGKLLWSTDAWKISIATVPSPVALEGGKLFLSGGYNAGSMMLQVSGSGESFQAQPLWRLKANVFASEQQTPLYWQGHVFGLRGPDEGQMVCLDEDGKIVWASGRDNRFGKGGGPYLIADGLLYVMDDEGKLSMLEASASGFKLLDEAVVLSGGKDSWGPMALAGGRLLCRDLTRLVCLDVRAE